MNVDGEWMFIHQRLRTGLWKLWFGKVGSTALSNAAQDGYEGEAQLFLSDTLALNFNNRCSALAGAARTT